MSFKKPNPWCGQYNTESGQKRGSHVPAFVEKRVCADNLHVGNCITNMHCTWILQFPWVCHCVNCRFMWYLIQEDRSLQSLSALRRQRRCCIHCTYVGCFHPLLFSRNNLTEKHQYLLPHIISRHYIRWHKCCSHFTMWWIKMCGWPPAVQRLYWILSNLVSWF